MTREQLAVHLEIEKLKSMGITIHYCDPETMTIIQENSDGTKIDTKHKVIRYGEKSRK